MNMMHTICLRCGKPAVSIPSNYDKLGMNVSYTHYSYCEECLREGLKMLKEQEPKTGKWILDDEDANSWECSECGGLTVINDGTPHENNWYFCPHCGAKLEEQVMKME